MNDTGVTMPVTDTPNITTLVKSLNSTITTTDLIDYYYNTVIILSICLGLVLTLLLISLYINYKQHTAAKAQKQKHIKQQQELYRLLDNSIQSYGNLMKKPIAKPVQQLKNAKTVGGSGSSQYSYPSTDVSVVVADGWNSSYTSEPTYTCPLTGVGQQNPNPDRFHVDHSQCYKVVLTSVEPKPEAEQRSVSRSINSYSTASSSPDNRHSSPSGANYAAQQQQQPTGPSHSNTCKCVFNRFMDSLPTTPVPPRRPTPYIRAESVTQHLMVNRPTCIPAREPFEAEQPTCVDHIREFGATSALEAKIAGKVNRAFDRVLQTVHTGVAPDSPLSTSDSSPSCQKPGPSKRPY